MSISSCNKYYKYTVFIIFYESLIWIVSKEVIYEYKKQEFDITGMHCAACVKRVENVVSKVDGVASVKVNLLTRKGSVEFKDGATVEPQQIIDAITNIGFGATEADETKQEIEKVNLKPHITRLIIAACMAVPMMINMPCIALVFKRCRFGLKFVLATIAQFGPGPHVL